MTNKPKILIAGAAGRTGSIATRMLLERGYPVRAMVRKDDERARKLADLGAEIFVGDYLDLRSVRRAFEGVKRAYFVYPMRPGLVEATANYAMAGIEAKAEFILNISQRTSRPDATSDSAMHHWLAERVFDWAPIPVAHLQPTAFNEWLTIMQRQIREGLYAVPFGPKGRFAPISCEDQGAVITEILADPWASCGADLPASRACGADAARDRRYCWQDSRQRGSIRANHRRAMGPGGDRPGHAVLFSACSRDCPDA